MSELDPDRLLKAFICLLFISAVLWVFSPVRRTKVVDRRRARRAKCFAWENGDLRAIKERK